MLITLGLSVIYVNQRRDVNGDIGQRSILPAKWIECWNELPQEIREAKDLQTFKVYLNKFIDT